MSRTRLRRHAWRGAIGVGVALLAVLLVPVGEEDPPWQEELGERELGALSELESRLSREGAQRDLGWLDPHGLLARYVEMDGEGLRWRLDTGDPWSSVPWSSSSLPMRPPLDGLRLLLDPGHFGGAWAEAENRQRQLGGGEPVREGVLTWATARLLERELLAQGVAVVLSRGEPPTESFTGVYPGFRRELEIRQALGERRGDWPLCVAHHRSLVGRWLVARQLAALRDGDPFALFGRFDLRRRARRAESFAAEVTLSIHYNTVGPQQRNGILAFVHGSLLPGELVTRSQRFWAIRRLLEGALADSVALADALVEEASLELGLPRLTAEPLAGRSNKVPIVEHPGVFARNLGLLRRAPGVAVLFEGPPVDHPEEYARLQDRSLTVDGRAVPARVEVLAQSLARGLLRWRNGGSQ